MCKTKNIFIALFVLFFLAYGNAKADANQSLISKVSFGRAADVDILLAQKANPNATNSAGLSAVFIAAARSDAEAPKIISSLIKAGADVNFASPNGGLPIIEAVRSGNPQNVKLLIDGGAAMSVKDLRGNDLTKIAQNRSDDKIITLVQAGIAAEQKKLGSLKGGDNLTKLVQKYSFDICSSYYISYYKRDNPSKMSDKKYSELIANNDASLNDTKNSLTALFDMKPNGLNYIKTQTQQQIKDKLDSLLTNENRLYNNFGTKTDLNNKCSRISQTWNGARFTYVTKKNGKQVITGYK